MIRNNADETAVRAVLDRIYAAWAANDAEAFVAPYASDASAALPGSYLSSRDAICATMASLFAGPLKGSRAVYEVDRIRFLGPSDAAAVVNSRGAMLGAGEDQPVASAWMRETWVLSKASGGWRVDAFHQSPERV